MVPLYRQICDVLGITATRTIAESTRVDTSRRVKVEFVASVGGADEPAAKMFPPAKIAAPPAKLVPINLRRVTPLRAGLCSEESSRITRAYDRA